MPALSPTMTEGNLSKWLIKKGDTVKAGDLIAEIETDKATMEVEAVDEGVVLDLLFKEGEANIPVNKAIAIIGDPKETIEISDQLYQKNILVSAIRPPTVPKGTSRLRISITAAHTTNDINLFVQAITSILNRRS